MFEIVEESSNLGTIIMARNFEATRYCGKHNAEVNELSSELLS